MSEPADRAATLAAAYDARLMRDLTVPGTGLTVRLERAPQVIDGRLWLWLAVTRDGVRLPVSNPFIVVNPPLRRGGDTEDRPLAALVRVVEDAARRAAWRR